MLALALASLLSTQAIDVPTARSILFDADSKLPDASKCSVGTDAQKIACLIDLRYASDKAAAKIARGLYEKTGCVSGLLGEQDFDGEYRGMIHFVPHMPVKADRKHLEWLSSSVLEIDTFFGKLEKPVKFRWRDLDLRFFRSVKRRTPSAIAHGWQVSYNVSGSLFTSAARVRETMFHELFHLNDTDHGSSSLAWAEIALVDVYKRIVDKCGIKTECLTPYAPDRIIVRVPGGTYYGFMPDNGVREYAADLAKRWYIEQATILQKKKVAKPFKCITPENGEAWTLIVNEFFGGIDLTPPCT